MFVGRLLETDQLDPPRPQRFRPPLPRPVGLSWLERGNHSQLWNAAKTALELPAFSDRRNVINRIGNLDYSICFGIVVDMRTWTDNHEILLAEWLSELATIELSPSVAVLTLIIFDPAIPDFEEGVRLVAKLIERIMNVDDVVILPPAKAVELDDIVNWKAELFSDTDLNFNEFSLYTLEAQLFPTRAPQRLAEIFEKLCELLRAACQY